MPKKKKNSLTYSPEAVREVRKKLKGINKKRVLTLFLSTVAVFSVATAVMFTAVTILAVAVIFLNHGFTKKDFTPDMLREDVPADEAERICEKLNSHRKIAKKLMMILIPLMLALLLDIISLFYGDALGSFFRFLVPSK